MVQLSGVGHKWGNTGISKRRVKLEIMRDPDACYGCRTCQVICSFHHRGEFSTEFSDIHVLKNHRTAAIKWSIDLTCDLCKGEEEPLCVKYCQYRALKAR